MSHEEQSLPARSAFGRSLSMLQRVRNPIAFGRWATAEGRRHVIDLGRWATLIEWVVMFIIVVGFCAPFLSWDQGEILAGNESEMFQSLDWVLVNSLRLHGQFPLWNPYLQTGLPYVADPMTHVFNPVVSVPVLLFGVVNGFKVAVFLSFLAAAAGAWWLATIVGVGRPTRLWVALMYAFTGQAVAKFLQGHYLFIFGFAWIPWVLAGLIAVMRTRRRLHAASVVVALGLLFFSGNLYYTFYMLILIAIFAAVWLVGWDRGASRVTFHRDRALVLLGIGLLALCLVAVQLLPQAEFWPRVRKATERGLTDSHNVRQIVAAYLSRDSWSTYIIDGVPREDYYAYTGIWPFAALLFLPLALWKRRRRPLIFFGLMLVAMVVYIGVRYMPWADWYERTYVLSQFRHPTRMLLFGALALVVLAGLGLDTVWRMLRGAWRNHRRWRAIRVLAGAGLVVLITFMIVAVGDIYATNRQRGDVSPRFDTAYAMMGWLRQHDAGEYYVYSPSNWHGAIVSNHLRYIGAWLYFTDVRQLDSIVNRRPVVARPNYVALADGTAHDYTDPVVVRRFDGHTLYELPHSLPYAFAVDNAQLFESGQAELSREDVRPITPYVAGPNRIEAIVEADAGTSLVVLTAFYPGWKVSLDGRGHELKNVGGYLATDLVRGIHKYVFSYDPLSFKIGLIVSLMALLVTAGLGLSDLRLNWRAAVNGLRDLRLPDVILRSPVRKPGAGVTWMAGVRLGWLLFGLSLVVYLVTRLYALDRFPIYFFSDEAIHGVLARDLIDNGFRYQGTLMPTYFQNYQFWNLSLSVYVHAISVALFGKSVVVLRATAVMVSLLGVAAVGLMLKTALETRFWWLGVLVLTVTPAWFIHSRTGFETVIMVSFYAVFLLFYLLYRCRDPRYLYPAIVFGAATFYAYANGQAVMAVTAVLLLISDLPYHWANRRTVATGFLLALLLSAPYLRFRNQHPAEIGNHLRILGSYWASDMPLADKAGQFGSTYLSGLSPAYWFFPNAKDLVRHRWGGYYGHLIPEMLPLFLLGVGLSVWRIRSAPHRAILIAALAAPFGAATVDIGITRVLAFVVPAAIFITLGLSELLSWLAERVPRRGLALASFAFLSLFGLYMLRSAVVHGPNWYRDYGLYGMQYGAKQVFDVISDYLTRQPQTEVILSSSWANGTDTYPPFFVDGDSRVRMLSVNDFMTNRRPLTGNMLFVMTDQEFQRAQESDRFKRIDVEHIIPYPDGRPGFYFARLQYVDNIEAILAEEREARRRLVEAPAVLDGEPIQVRHSLFDAGQVQDMFDGDWYTLARVMEANPAIVEVEFSEPRAVSGMAADFGSMEFELNVEIFAPGTEEPTVYGATYRNTQPDPHAELTFDQASDQVARIRVQIRDLNASGAAKIHIRELDFR